MYNVCLIFYCNKPVLINRYFAQELFYYLLTVTLIVLAIFLGNQLIRYLNDAASGNMALLVIGKLLLLEIPYLLGLLLPITFFIALLLMLGRLSTDQELVILKACGFSPWQQWQLISFPCISVVLSVALLSLFIQPKIAAYRNQLLATTNAGASLDTLVPGKFQAGFANRYVFYVEKSTPNHQYLQNIFVAEANKDKKNSWNLIKAKNSQLVTDIKNQAQFIQINDGYRYAGTLGLTNYTTMYFDHYFLLTRNPTTTNINNETDSYTNAQLIRIIYSGKNTHANEKLVRLAIAELEWRLSLPISCLLLSVIGLLFGVVPARHGRYSRLLIGILFLIIYVNLLLTTRSWVSNGIISPLPGIFSIHLLVLISLLFYFTPWQKYLSSQKHKKT